MKQTGNNFWGTDGWTERREFRNITLDLVNFNTFNTKGIGISLSPGLIVSVENSYYDL